MTVEERIKKATEFVSAAPQFRIEDYTPADSYARANYHLLLAVVELLREGA